MIKLLDVYSLLGLHDLMGIKSLLFQVLCLFMLISPDLKAFKFKTLQHLQPFCQGERSGQQLYQTLQTLVTAMSDVHLIAFFVNKLFICRNDGAVKCVSSLLYFPFFFFQWKKFKIRPGRLKNLVSSAFQMRLICWLICFLVAFHASLEIASQICKILFVMEWDILDIAELEVKFRSIVQLCCI